jgi:hypothetical protein
MGRAEYEPHRFGDPLARTLAAPATRRGRHWPAAGARVAAVISSRFLGVFAVAAGRYEPRRGHVIYSGVSAAVEVMSPT